MHVVNQTITKACFYVSEILTGKQGYNAFAYFSHTQISTNIILVYSIKFSVMPIIHFGSITVYVWKILFLQCGRICYTGYLYNENGHGN